MPSHSDIFYQLLPFPRLLRAQKLVSAASPERDARRDAWVGLGRDKLLTLIDLEWARAQALDEKLFKLTTALSVAVTAGGAIAKTLLDSLIGWPLRWAVFGLLIYAILLLFAGTVMGFSGLRPKARTGYGPDFALEVRRNGPKAARAAAGALADFEVKNILRSNEASAANLAIRNGVLAFAAALLISLFAPPKAAPATEPTDVRISLHRSTISLAPQAERSGETPRRHRQQKANEAGKP